MHRAVLVALVALVLCSLVVSVVDADFAFRPTALLLALVISVLVSGAVTYGCAAVVRVPPGTDSWLITALILYFILPGVTDAASAVTVVLGAATAAASKYVLVWRRRLIVNPAVAGTVVVYVCAYAEVAGVGYPQWWVAADPMLIPMVVIGVLLVAVLREWVVVTAFLVAALATIGVLQIVQGGQDLSVWLVSSPMFFVAAVMVTEPMTSPSTRVHRIVYGAGIGVLMYCQQTIPLGSAVSIEFVPEVALLAGSLYAAVVRVARSRGAGRTVLTVSEVTQVAADTFSVTATPAHRVPFRPGQWARLSAPTWTSGVGGRSRRVFSIASAPTDDELSFAFVAGREPSDFKADLIERRTTTLFLDEVGGDFVLRPGAGPAVLIASGIGITPFRSMLRAATATDLSRVTLVHIVRTPDRAVYADDLAAAESVGSRIVSVIDPAAADGVSADLLRELLADHASGTRFYLSGPPTFVRVTARAVRRVAPATRWARWRIHTDVFLGY